MKRSLLSSSVLFLCIFATTGCCYKRCGFACRRAVCFPSCSPCQSVSPCGGISTGCDSCSGGISSMPGPMMSSAGPEGYSSQGMISGPYAAGMPAPGSDSGFIQPLPPPLPSNGVMTMPPATIPVSSEGTGTFAPMGYRTFTPAMPMMSHPSGSCATCNH